MTHFDTLPEVSYFYTDGLRAVFTSPVTTFIKYKLLKSGVSNKQPATAIAIVLINQRFKIFGLFFHTIVN